MLERTIFEQFVGQSAKALGTTSAFKNSDSEVVDWMDNENPPTDEALNAKIAELKAEYDANQYQRDRQYPSIGDQLDMQYHDQINGTTTWKDAIAKVKADNPKPE